MKAASGRRGSWKDKEIGVFATMLEAHLVYLDLHAKGEAKHPTFTRVNRDWVPSVTLDHDEAQEHVLNDIAAIKDKGLLK